MSVEDHSGHEHRGPGYACGIKEKLGLSAPHTVHCSHLIDPDRGY